MRTPTITSGWGPVVEAFPKARVVALASVARTINRQFFGKLDHWEKVIGATNVCRKTVNIEPLNQNHIELEGKQIEIIPEVMGDLKYNSVVWIPSIKTLYGSDCPISSFNTPFLGSIIKSSEPCIAHQSPEFTSISIQTEDDFTSGIRIVDGICQACLIQSLSRRSTGSCGRARGARRARIEDRAPAGYHQEGRLRRQRSG
jgi:hypothetical protein